jgi:hypothetical protein
MEDGRLSEPIAPRATDRWLVASYFRPAPFFVGSFTT